MAAGQKKLQETMAAAKRALTHRRGVGDRAQKPTEPKDEEPVQLREDQRRGADYVLEDVIDKLSGGSQVKIGKAFRRKPMIDTLAAAGVFSDAEFKALTHYRRHADIADRSPLRDSLNMQRYGGTGTGPTIEMLNAVRVRDDVERAVGTLLDIFRAVVVDDVSLSQWAIAKWGSVEKVKRGKTVIEPKPGKVSIARLEIQMAAKRAEAELSA